MRSRREAYRRGLEAEERCAEFLRAQGYIVLGTRIRTRAGEIDLLAVDGDTLVIVEVKARSTEAESLYAVTRSKQKRLMSAALALLAEPGKIPGLGASLPPNMRFDAMAVLPQGLPVHVRDAWRE